MSQLREIDIHTYILYISDEPEPEFSSSSRAEMGHFNFRTETELDFFFFIFSNLRFLAPRKKRTNGNQHYLRSFYGMNS